MSLQEDFVAVVVAHLTAGLRKQDGSLRQEEQADLFMQIAASNELDNPYTYFMGPMFIDFGNIRHPTGYPNFPTTYAAITQYIGSLEESERQALNNNKLSIGKAILKRILERNAAMSAVAAKAKLLVEQDGKDGPAESRRKVGVNIQYLMVLVVIIGLLAVLVAKGFAEKPDVSIEFNVGEIIGALLIGTGAAVAGLAYARRHAEHIEIDRNRDRA